MNRPPASGWIPLHSHNPKTWDADCALGLLNGAIGKLRTCGGCRQHAMDYVAANTIDFSTRDAFHDYLWRFHNSVNARIKNPSNPEITWEEYRKQWLRWKPVDGLKIGFIASCFEQFGGTETFHETIVRRLPGVIGFVSMYEIKRDASILGVPSDWGESAIESLARNSDVIVAWNIDWSHRERPKKLVTVHHGSPFAVFDTQHAIQGDRVVAVSSDTADFLRQQTEKPVVYIPNAVDPDRIKPQKAVDTNGKKICLWSHRFVDDKGVKIALEIAKCLPEDWHMVMTGYRGEDIEPNDRVTVLPPTHPGDWLAVASCFLSTSLYEGFGLSMAEASAAGVPIVATPVGIASRPGVAITVPIDASPVEWAKAIVSSSSHELTSLELFSLDAHITAWREVVWA